MINEINADNGDEYADIDHSAFYRDYEATYNDDDMPALTEFQKGRLESIAQKNGVSAESLRKSAFLMALIRHAAWQKEA
jgi:hypothetical protein